MVINNNGKYLTWKHMLSSITEIQIPFEEFIEKYLKYKHAFYQCPFDVPAYIYLIQLKVPRKNSSMSILSTYLQQSDKLELNRMTFFQEFEPIFDNGLRKDLYQPSHINVFLATLSSYEALFPEYLTIYASNVIFDQLWATFLSLSVISNLDINMCKYLSTVLVKNISWVPFSSFQQYVQSAESRLNALTKEKTPRFVKIFEDFYDAFINKEIRNLSGYKENDIKYLINIPPVLFPNGGRRKPTSSLIIQQLIFRIDPPTLDTSEKLKRLFKNITDNNNTILRNFEPNRILEDEWLKVFIIDIPQGWLKLDENTYRYLCNNHQNNPWTIDIWSRIVNLSVLKVTNDNLNTTLVDLNNWMKTVRHDVYQANDILTIIFVGHLFEILVSKHRFIVTLPNIESIIKFVIAMKTNQSNQIDKKKIDEFIEDGRRAIESILQLKDPRGVYCRLLTNTVIHCFLPYVDLKAVVLPALYRFPQTSAGIDAIMSLPKPRDLNSTIGNSREEFFNRFVHDINDWFPYIDRFFNVFQPIIDWLDTYNINRVHQIANDLSQIKTQTKVAVSLLKTTVEDISKVLSPFNDLRRLCHLFNCLISFRIIEQGTFNNQIPVLNFIKELERFHPTNTFLVEGQTTIERKIPITDHQNVRWSLVSTNYPCKIKVEYQTDDFAEASKTLYENTDAQIQRNILQGRFETERNGQLIITIDNRQRQTIQIWYQIRSVNLSTCHLFHGILRMQYERYYHQSNIILTEKQFSKLVDETFRFIDELLSGNLTLRDMKSLQTVFFDKNIHIKNEVEKLFTSRSREQINHQEIEQVCEWLQVYQYYSHIANIINCIQKFDILSSDTEDETIGRIQSLGGDDDRTLRDATQEYQILQERFQHLTHQHLQLIKTAVECSNVVQMMKKADLYSDQGRSRFQRLRDNLTTQFQLQERNNMILNAWIITYALLEPFMYKVNKFDDFLARIARLTNLEESSLNYIKIVNDNSQIVNMWLSAEDTSVLDNALITMGYIYKNGVVDIHLSHLINEPSYFEIGYWIDRNQDQNQENDKLKFTKSMSDIDDHKRQLAFCNVDVQQNRFYSKTLIDCQLKLLQKIERIYSILTKLEMSGHPDYQLREERYVIHAYTNQDNPSIVQLEQEAKQRTSVLDNIYERFEDSYSKWIRNLEKFREECFLLKLFSDRQIMILIILLKQSASLTSIRRRFLQKLYSFQNPLQRTDEEQQFTFQCLRHYLSSLRIQQTQDLIEVYEKHKIDTQSDTEVCLRKLSLFLQDLFNHGNELMEQRSIIDTDQQYLISLNPNEENLDINTFCILINLLNNRLPSSFQILWCTSVRNEDIKLFFSRIRTFRYLIFIIMDIDKMNHRLRETLLTEQDRLTRDQVEHGTIFYFSKELTISRNGLREFHIPQKYRNIDETLKQLTSLFQKNHLTQTTIEIIYGAAGIGKTHRINTQYNNGNLSCFSINDNLNLSSLIRSFLSFNSRLINTNPLIYFNISIHAPFEELNRTLFSLFICGSLMDIENGLVFSLLNDHPWEFIIEVPYSTSSQLSYKANFDHILPLLSIITPKKHLEEITGYNYQLFIGEDEEKVARFLKAYENRTIDRLHTDENNVEHLVTFDELTNGDECRDLIYNCMNNYAPELPRNKICELSFTKFLYRRIRFFLGHFYQYNQQFPHLGTIAMKQMIEEAKILTQISFRDETHRDRVFLVYDDNFSLHLLHNDWNSVSTDLKQLFGDKDPRLSDQYRGKDYFVECLAWLIDIPYRMFEEILNENKFILTENFAYKLFHVHERKLTRLPLIIEGDTGVGKTFLLKFYSILLHTKNTRDHPENVIMPRIRYNMNRWLLNIISTNVENQEVFLKTFVHQIKREILGLENNDENNLDPLPEQVDLEFLNQIKRSLGQSEYNEKILYFMWKTLLTISNDNHLETTSDLIKEFYDYVSEQLAQYPLIESRMALKELLQVTESPTIQLSIDLCQEYLFHCQMKPIFYRLLLHPGITEEQIFEFMNPIIQLANELYAIELVVFFDEVNTSSCLGLFKEMFMDGTLHGRHIPKNIFFTAAINPYMENKDKKRIHRNDFNVYKLPESLENLVVPYGALKANTLGDYIARKIAMFQISSTTNGGRLMPLDDYVQQALTQCILVAQQFCEERLGANTVSQREIQRCFSLIEFFWRMRYDNEIEKGEIVSDPNPIRCIALSLALIYYFRLPTKEHIEQERLENTPSREELAEILSQFIPEFDILIQRELYQFVNTNNFVIPAGVAINQAVREHIFSIVVSIVTRTPLCIIGVPGQSKTLSFQIVLKNLQGVQLSPKAFCKRLPSVDPFFCLGSKYTQSDDIAYAFERAIKREQHYEQNGIDTRCVVFLDEASLPNEKQMVLKVLHPYLDECKVAFVAIANQSFDAANANRMICIYRSLPSKDDQKILAYGCLGLQTNQNQFDDLITGLCQGYRRVLQSPEIRRIFHDRDFIYMLRELRFELTSTNEEQALSIGEITPQNFIRALEDNFNGVTPDEFHRLVKIFFEAIQRKCPNFALTKEIIFRDIPAILRQSMKLDSKRRKLYGRYKLIIDESEDESAVQLLFQSGIISTDPEQTTIFRMADFPDDIDNELRNVEILSTIKLCMETGKTILMVNTGRIHGSLYDVFNQNFSIMATDETRKIFSKVAIGPKTMDVVVHENFQCLVLMKRSEFDETPAPFLSRFQKYIFDVQNFYSIQLKQLSHQDQTLMRYVKERVLSFVQHFGQQYFYGYNESTIYSCLLSLIQKDENGQYYLTNIHQKYSQLTIKSKSFIEQNSANDQECILYYLLSQLIQLVSPESMIYKLRTFEEDFARLLYKNYFHQQEHFDIKIFIQQILSFSSDNIENEENRNITTKFMLFTRTSAFITGLNENSKEELSQNLDQIDIIKLTTIENSAILNEHVQTYVDNAEKQVMIIIVDGRIRQQRQYIPFIRQLIDKTDQLSNKPNEIPRKYFVILIHSTNQELNHQLCFPSIFLHRWDYYFLDTSTSGSAFHLQKILQALTSTYHTPDQDQFENINANLCDYSRLFNDCLWDFCSKLQVFPQNLSSNMFSNPSVREFYQRETSTVRRVECLKQILQQSPDLEQRIVNIYYENMIINQKTFEKMKTTVYQLSKDVLCGKRTNSLVDSLQSQIRTTFTNFISNILKHIVNDYGLETLSKLSHHQYGYEVLLNLIDCSSFAINEETETDSSISNRGYLSLTNHYSCIPQTPLYHLFHQRIKTLAEQIKPIVPKQENDSFEIQNHDDSFENYFADAPTTMNHGF